jgi:integrase/recombinase XerC
VILNSFFYLYELHYSDTPIAHIQHFHIRSWLASLKENDLESRSMNRKISTLKSFYKFLLRKGEVSQSPMSKIISPKNAKRLPVFVNQSNMESLLDQAEFEQITKVIWIDLYLKFFIKQVCVRAELLGIKLHDVDLYNHQIKVLGKGNKERIIPIARELQKLNRVLY